METVPEHKEELIFSEISLVEDETWKNFVSV